MSASATQSSATPDVIRLYHCSDARSFRVLWALEELGLDYQLVMLPFPPRLQQPQYLKINPLGTIPALIDGPVKMTESVAICEYLAARHGAGRLTVPPDHPAFGAYLNFLHMGEATLTFPQTIVLRYTALEAARGLGVIADDYARWFKARLKAAVKFIGPGPYLVGNEFTLADISFGYALKLADSLQLINSAPAPVPEYWLRLQQRPAYRRACERERLESEKQGVMPFSIAEFFAANRPRG